MEKINYQGTLALYLKEVKRFMKVYNQTLLIPVASALLFLAVFKLALGNRISNIGTLPYDQFMAAGLIMMAVIQNAFANTSSSFIMGKVLGTFIDYLMPPFSSGEIIFAMVLAGVTRGIIVGVLVAVAVFYFVPVDIYSYAYIIFYIVAGSLFLSILGMFAGIVAETFDQMAAVTSYVIVPMSFLSGTFYSVNSLPEFWQHLTHLNPFFYMIDGFRYGLTGYHDSNLTLGMIFIITVIIALWSLVYFMMYKGYRIKS